MKKLKDKHHLLRFNISSGNEFSSSAIKQSCRETKLDEYSTSSARKSGITTPKKGKRWGDGINGWNELL